MKYLILLIITLFIFNGCSKQQGNIVKMNDIKSYLLVDNNKKSKDLENANTNINFWAKRLKDNPGNSFFQQTLAGWMDSRFRLTGNIDDLLTADTLLQAANKDAKEHDVSLLHGLSQNAISRHQFKLALEYARKAFTLTEARFTSAMLLADVLMETGSYDEAHSILIMFKDSSALPYLIRTSRFYQHEGNLDSAIIDMKAAYSIAEHDNNNSMVCFADNLIGTYSIEAGNMQQAYDVFLDALKHNPNYIAAIEGIATIAIVNDKNTDIAKDIYESLSQSLSSPDPYLNLYKIAKYNNDEAKKQEYLKTFLAKATDARYGRMYNKYVVNIEAEEFKNFPKAKQIAESEIAERPTPSSYFMLAWAYFQNGDTEKSIEIIKQNVEGKTTDPETLTKIDRIYLEQTKKM